MKGLVILSTNVPFTREIVSLHTLISPLEKDRILIFSSLEKCGWKSIGRNGLDNIQLDFGKDFLMDKLQGINENCPSVHNQRGLRCYFSVNVVNLEASNCNA